MALNGYMNICIFWKEFLIGPLFIAWDSPLLVLVCAGSFIAPLSQIGAALTFYRNTPSLIIYRNGQIGPKKD